MNLRQYFDLDVWLHFPMFPNIASHVYWKSSQETFKTHMLLKFPSGSIKYLPIYLAGINSRERKVIMFPINLVKDLLLMHYHGNGNGNTTTFYSEDVTGMRANISLRSAKWTETTR